jgi:hypothetical protein
MYRVSRCVVGVLAGVAVLVPGAVAAEPGEGSIVIRARVAEPGAGEARFGYRSDLSPGGRFELDAAGSGVAEATFTPVAGSYTVKEIVPAGWALSGVGCGITRPGGGFPDSGVSVDFGAGEVEVSLAAGDVVTCTYANATSSGSERAGL